MEVMELLDILRNGESASVEFKETLNKDISKAVCAFANTKGGRILIGVKDDGTPIGVNGSRDSQEISDQLQKLRPMPRFLIEEIPIAKTKIISIEVEESTTLISSNNTVYIRVGTNNYPLSIDEVIEKSAESLRIFFDQIKTDIPASELDKELFLEYLKQRQKTRGVEFNGDVFETAVRLKVLVKKDKGLFLTNAGILCFSKDPQKYIGNSTVRLTKFDDNEMKTYSMQKEFSGTLQKIIKEIERFFIDNLNRTGGFTIGFKRQEFLEYPLLALREAIINAVVHRNYFDAAEIRIFIFPDRIEIKNPGSFPPGISVDNPEHKPRNPYVAQYFFDLGLTEKYGSGIQKIIREVSEHPLVSVQFNPKPYNTTVIFRKSASGVNLDSTNVKILELLSTGPKGSSIIAGGISLSRQAAIDRLKNLRTLGFIRQEGEGSKTVYALSKTLKDTQ